MPKEHEWTYQETIDIEIRQLAHKLKGNCIALFQLPLMIYNQIMLDNQTRKKPFRVSFKRIEDMVHSMPELYEDKQNASDS